MDLHVPSAYSGVLCPPRVCLRSFTGQVFPDLPCFDRCTCSEGKPKNMNGGGQPPLPPLKQGKPGSIHHVSGRKVDVGGEGLIFKFLTGQDE